MKHLRRGLPALVACAALVLAACGGGGGGGSDLGQGPVSPVPVASAPGAPTNPVATPGKASATVTFTAPGNNGGSAITGYTVTSSPPGGRDTDAGTNSLTHVMTGLSNGVSYTFTVTATNAVGSSAASAASNAATPEQPVQWSATGSLQVARAGHTATLLPDGKVLVAGSATTSLEVYDPSTRQWTTVGAAYVTPYGRTATTVLQNGKVLVDKQLYDPSKATVTSLPGTWGGFYNYADVLLPNGKLLRTGGYIGDNTNTAVANLYDPASNSWGAAAPMGTPRGLHTATLLPNGKVLVAGGADASPELYDPVSNTWTATARSPVKFWMASATLLPNGKVLFVPELAYFFDGVERNASLYDPATDSWTLAGTVATDRAFHTATLLSNGTVLVVGGGRYSAASGFTSGSDIAELYDPATNAWSPSSPMVLGARSKHTATLLRNGSVLVVGGHAADGSSSQPARSEAALYELL